MKKLIDNLKIDWIKLLVPIALTLIFIFIIIPIGTDDLELKSWIGKSIFNINIGDVLIIACFVSIFFKRDCNCKNK